MPSDIYFTKDLFQKKDVYAMAKTLIEVLLGDGKLTDDNQPLGEDSDVKKEQIIKRLDSCGIPKSIAEVLITGLGSQTERPSASEFKSKFESALGSNKT